MGKSIDSKFRIKIISPIMIDDADLRRRQIRYSEHANQNTKITVFNLIDGPKTLSTPGDILFSEFAIFQEGMATNPKEFDAILIDCAFDPALDELVEQGPVPTFGPMKATLAMMAQVAKKFSFISRSDRQIGWLRETASTYGYENMIASSRALSITYEQSRSPKTFDKAMKKQLNRVVADGAEAVVMGSTTMALSKEVIESAQGLPIFLPGMVAVSAMEALWADGLIR